MTDNEIIKALGCCKSGGCEDGCPFYADREKCVKLDDIVLDLINRQKTEIDILIRKKESLRDEIAEKDAEIERLKSDIDWYKKAVHNLSSELTEQKGE